MAKKIERVYHPWWKWECYKAGFFNTSPPDGLDEEECKERYRVFLSDLSRFGRAMDRVLGEWPHSCEQFLTNPTMNKIAWLGQAALCIDTGIPSKYRAGFKLLTEEQQQAADQLAAEYLDKWRSKHKHHR